MGFTVEDKYLIKCSRVSRRNEYLISTLVECLIPQKYTLKILYKSKHFPPRYNSKREWFFFRNIGFHGRSQTSEKNIHIFFYISVENVSIYTKFSGVFVRK